jgi:PDZ domain-containing protein
MVIHNREMWRTWLVGGMVLILVFVLLFMVPMPYYIVQPGSALEVRPMIQVEDTSHDEKGTFYMTTVSMREGNLFGTIASLLDPRLERVPRQEVLGKDGDPKRYQYMQTEIMKQSQNNAVLAAYREAGKPVKEKLLGVEVFRVLEGMPAAKVLKPGDIIQQADGHPIKSTEELLAYLDGKKPGERVRLLITRDGDKKEQELELASLAQSGGEDRPGVGIEPVTLREVEARPKVTIRADDIGGPSAGLMFSLEILNQLRDQDLTHGLRVAGTGTIDPEGKVGQIGGIHHKIVAAERENADIFFVPADQKKHHSNEKKAKETAREIGSDMAIVPVRTLKDAVRYLEAQESKPRAS